MNNSPETGAYSLLKTITSRKKIVGGITVAVAALVLAITNGGRLSVEDQESSSDAPVTKPADSKFASTVQQKKSKALSVIDNSPASQVGFFATPPSHPDRSVSPEGETLLGQSQQSAQKSFGHMVFALSNTTMTRAFHALQADQEYQRAKEILLPFGWQCVFTGEPGFPPVRFRQK